MVDISSANKISLEEAKKLLTADCGKQTNDKIFDIYGNYSYPFETKLSTPNTAVGAIGKNY